MHFANAITLHVASSGGQTNDISESDLFTFTEQDQLDTTIEGFRIVITFHPDWVDNPLLRGHTMPGVRRFTMTAQRDEKGFDPNVPEHYEVVREAYRNVLFLVINRLIDFFKYKQGNPFLRHLNAGHILEWEWLDDAGKVLRSASKGMIFHEFPGFPRTRGSLDSKALKRRDLPELLEAIGTTQGSVSVIAELRLQAQEAIFEGKLSFAVLLLAIATEVAIKTAFFRADRVASEAFDYLEERRQVQITPMELIHKVAKRSFGESFRESNEKEYGDLDNLFRCRNKVAHRGEGVYRDGKEKLRILSRDTLNEWWHSISTLLAWLETKAA